MIKTLYLKYRKLIPGSLKHISVAPYGDYIWGVNKYDQIFYRRGVNGKWIHADPKGSRLKQLSISRSSTHI